jgi:hypothetical protein
MLLEKISRHYSGAHSGLEELGAFGFRFRESKHAHINATCIDLVSSDIIEFIERKSFSNHLYQNMCYNVDEYTCVRI